MSEPLMPAPAQKKAPPQGREDKGGASFVVTGDSASPSYLAKKISLDSGAGRDEAKRNRELSHHPPAVYDMDQKWPFIGTAL